MHTMKKRFTLFFLGLLTCFYAQAQTTMTMMYEGVEREFIVYVPEIYDTENVAVPVLLSLHGLGDNMNNFSNAGFHHIADTANFIVVTPQALVDPNPLLGLVGAAWNSGATFAGIAPPNQGVDDAGFLLSIVDHLATMYQVDHTRIYATGFSMGAYMTNRLACEKSHRMAAIASVAGTIGSLLTCEPANKIPSCHFHGTADQTITFTNNGSGMDPEAMVNFWVTHNECDTPAVMTALPDIASDGYTIEHYRYENTTSMEDVEFFKVNGADHTWLNQNNDIWYAEEIWNFLSQYSREGATSIEELHADHIGLRIYPNPLTGNTLHLSTSTSVRFERAVLLNTAGQVVYEEILDGRDAIEVGVLPKGMYFVQLFTKDARITTKVFKY